MLISHSSTSVPGQPVMRIHITLLFAVAVAVASTDAIGFGDGEVEERGGWKLFGGGKSSYERLDKGTSTSTRESFARDVDETSESLEESVTKVTAAHGIEEEIDAVSGFEGDTLYNACSELFLKWYHEKRLPDVATVNARSEKVGGYYEGFYEHYM